MLDLKSVFAARSIRAERMGRALCWIMLLLIACAVIAAVGVAEMRSAAPSRRYKIFDLGTLTGLHSTASAINATGEIVGESTAAHYYAHAFHWKQGTMTDLGTGGNQVSIAQDINNSGLIVGYVVSPPLTMRAVLWKRGKIVKLPLVPGKRPSGPYGMMNAARGINTNGQVVGDIADPNGPQWSHACLWDGKKVIDLGTLPGGRNSQAQRINSAGQIAGNSDVGSGDTKPIHACLWDGKKTVDLGPPGSEHSEAHDINDSGAIVGEFTVNALHPGYHAVLYRNGKMTDLGLLPQCDTSNAYGINNKMEVVGTSGNFAASTYRAFLWRKGKMVDLNGLIDRRTGWMLEEARAINDRGEIVGSGRIKGKRHAFLLVPVPR